MSSDNAKAVLSFREPLDKGVGLGIIAPNSLGRDSDVQPIVANRSHDDFGVRSSFLQSRSTLHRSAIFLGLSTEYLLESLVNPDSSLNHTTGFSGNDVNAGGDFAA